MTRLNRSVPAPDQIANRLGNAKLKRRDFLRAGSAGLLGSLPFWRPAPVQAADTATAPTVSQPPLPVVDARFPCRIADGVWIIPDKRVPLVPNVGLIEGSRAVLVIDSGLNPESGRNILAAAQALAAGRELILTVTHAHPEHTFGAQAFKGHAKIYYNRLQRDYLDRDGLKLLTGFRSLLPPDRIALLDGVEITLADETYVGDRSFLDLGDRRVEFWTPGTAHSPGDQVITVPDQRVTFAGDLIEERMFPIVPFFPPLIEAKDISARTWQAVLKKMAGQAPRVMVPGHGNLGGTEIAEEVSDYLENVRKLVASSAERIKVETNAVSHLAEQTRSQHPTWERTEFIEPAIRYFAQNAEG